MPIIFIALRIQILKYVIAVKKNSIWLKNVLRDIEGSKNFIFSLVKLSMIFG